MIFNVNQSDYLPYVSDEAGVRLLVNPHGVPLSLERNGISVATGFRTSIALRQVKILSIGKLLKYCIGDLVFITFSLS